MKYQIWLHMYFPKNGCVSDLIMLHNENDSIYVRALNLVDIIRSTYLMNVNHETMPDQDYGFNIRYGETPADYLADIIQIMMGKVNSDTDLNLCHKLTQTDNYSLSITITKQ